MTNAKHQPLLTELTRRGFESRESGLSKSAGTKVRLSSPAYRVHVHEPARNLVPTHENAAHQRELSEPRGFQALELRHTASPFGLDFHTRFTSARARCGVTGDSESLGPWHEQPAWVVLTTR